MARFDVCRNLDRISRDKAPLVLVVQSDLLDIIPTVVVVPLVKPEYFKAASKLNPSFEIEGERFVLSTPELAGIPNTAMGQPVANLEHERDRIWPALKLLFGEI